MPHSSIIQPNNSVIKSKAMKKLKKLSFLTLISLLFITACKKDDDSPQSIIENLAPPAPSYVSASVMGTVINKAGSPIQNVIISANNNTTTTDENGVFLFNDIQVNEHGGLITAEKDGFYYNAKMIRPKKNKMTFTKIMLIEKTVTGTVPASIGGKVTTNGDASVELPANGFKMENGNNYDGIVNVYAHWIDPTSENLHLEMPGDLRAINLENNQVQLITFGMISVELEGINGQSLNLADGQTATIELPVPSELLANAPSTIPLWHFDEVSGYWKEEGEATLQGGKYIGTVTHFTTWNCDIPSDFIDLSGIVVSEAGGVGGLLINVSETTNGTYGYCYTNSDGSFRINVPRNQSLIIIAYDECGIEVHSQEIGSFSMDTQIDNIAINPTYDFVTFSGTMNCNGAVVDNGYIRVDFGSSKSFIPLDSDGNFSATLGACSPTEAIITGFDLTESKQNVAVSYALDGITSLDLGAINVCEIEFEEYFIATIGGHTYPTIIDFEEVSASWYTVDEVIEVSLSIETPEFLISLLTYNSSPNLSPYIIEFNGDFSDNSNSQNHNISYHQFGSSDSAIIYSKLDLFTGGFIEGTFEGTVEETIGGNTVPMSVEFKLIVN